MYEIQVSRERVKNHLQYDWWKYIIGVLATVFLWSMVTTMVRPQTPADKKVEIYLVGDYLLEEKAEPISDRILEEFPELLEVNFMHIPLGDDPQMEYMGRQKLMAMLASQTGDIFAFEKEEFEIMANQGAFMPLDDYIDDLKVWFSDEELEEYKSTVEGENESHYYGVPMESLGLFDETGYDVSNKVAGIMVYSKNQYRALNILKWILNNGMVKP